MDELIRPRAGAVWTTAEVARAFRVGVSSVKRWTDEGELETIRTSGGHRRYTLPAIYRFASIRSLPTDLLPRLAQQELFEEVPEPAGVTLYDALAAGDRSGVQQLVTPHVDSVVQRAAFLDRVVGESLREIGRRWARGELTVDEEHRASHLVVEALEHLRPREAREGRLAVLACPPGEWHEMPLHLVRLVLEWSGWRTELLGADTPWESAKAAAERRQAAILAFSARTRAPFEHADFGETHATCAGFGCRVITGGHWARGGIREFLRFRTLRGFEKWLRAS